MSLLGLAIQEVDRLDGGDAPLKTALIVLLWDTYVREQVASIMDFWLQASTGARSSKGLDPSIAGEFLHLAQQLLQVLSESIKSTVNTTRLAPPTDRHADDDDSVDPSARFSPDEALDLDQLLAPVVWTGTPNDVMNLYSKQWPSSPLHSALMQQLTRPGSPPTQESVDQHHQLVSVLIAFTSYPAAVVPLPSLFDLTSLCKSPSFKEAAELPANNFTMDLLRHDISLGMSVASSLRLQLDQIKQAHAVWLYQGGQDALAEEVLDKVVVDAAVVTLLARVARSRLGLVLCRMQSRSEFAVLMSQLPADTCSWIRSSAPPLRPDPQVGIRDAAPSLTATNALLHQCVQWMPPATPEHARCLAMIGIVQLLLSQLKKSTNLASRKQNA
ncbi:hypothetical protein DYB26_002629 [Aphanomyces astaci]|uniref:Rab3GAP regulatory subunit C-terminal domain-containing protein n=2 Tax=Aphanomyces astaci TaxID=112090 RepID=A0A3R6YBA6_APHAT|nr:hypothetical protein DYB26_002629 [Aphanomyces astaci]